MKIAIAGAGVGGLTAALFLQRAGHQVTVLESVTELKELGVGINLLPHAVRELDKLGLKEHLLAIGVPTKELIYFNKLGQRIWQEPRGLDAGYRWPQISIHRGRLQRVLFNAFRSAAGYDAVRTGHRVMHATQNDSGVTVHVAVTNGSVNTTAMEVDVLIAADGIHSAIRKQFYPDEGLPLYSGTILWRAITRSKPFLSGRSMFMAGHPQAKFVAYAITSPDQDGMVEINWIAERRRERPLAREDWNRPGKMEDFLPLFEDWKFDWLDIPAVVRHCSTAVYEFPVIDRDPLPRWSFDRITLLGDAAHPMYPNGSNGASQAIRDASALADAFARQADPRAALRVYEESRLPATAKIVLSNRKTGPEVVMTMAEERAPQGFHSIENVIPRTELEEISAGYKKLAGFTRDALNAGTSILDGA